jgi:hypothetical protein
MLNPALDIHKLQHIFSRQRALSIQNVLQPQHAEAIHESLRDLDWYLEINDYEQNKRLRIPLSELKNPDAPLLNVLDEVEHNLNRHKLFYLRLNVDGIDFKSIILRKFAEFLNTEAFLDPMRRITGTPAITHCWMEATCYKSCCFLGGHRDDHHANNRVAFVFSLTPHWQLDWGGLLMLVNPDSHPVIVPPLWNSLSMFAVPRDHLVSAVSPGAQGERYSITGWLRDGSAG